MMIIFIIATLSFSLKVIPFLSKKFQFDQSSFLFQAAEYAVCYIIGSIIVSVAFSRQSATQLIESFDAQDVVVLVTLLFAYGFCKYTGSVAKSLSSSMILFIVSTLIVQNI